MWLITLCVSVILWWKSQNDIKGGSMKLVCAVAVVLG